MHVGWNELPHTSEVFALYLQQLAQYISFNEIQSTQNIMAVLPHIFTFGNTHRTPVSLCSKHKPLLWNQAYLRLVTKDGGDNFISLGPHVRGIIILADYLGVLCLLLLNDISLMEGPILFLNL